MPTLLSVNVATRTAGRKTGIHKVPQSISNTEGTLNAFLVDHQGLAQDFIGDLRHHGGSDQALYLYSREDYDWWQGQLGIDIPNGWMGDNLTIDRWWDDVRIGDCLAFALDSPLVSTAHPSIEFNASANSDDPVVASSSSTAGDTPTVVLQITYPRVPCNTLAQQMSDSHFVKAFVKARRPGYYARVLQTGSLFVGTAGQLVTDKFVSYLRSDLLKGLDVFDLIHHRLVNERTWIKNLTDANLALCASKMRPNLLRLHEQS